MTVVKKTISMDTTIYNKLIQYHGDRVKRSKVPLSLSNTIQSIVEEKLK